MNERADRFQKGKKSLAKQADMNAKQAAQNVKSLQGSFLDNIVRVAGIESKLQELIEAVNVNEWRVIGMNRILKRLLPDFTQDLVDQEVRTVQLEDFCRLSDAEDKTMGLLSADDESPQPGYWAIFTGLVYQSDDLNKVVQTILRSKPRLGAEKTEPEFDFALLQMKVGEVVSVTYEREGKEYVAGLRLLALKKLPPTPVAEPGAPSAPETDLDLSVVPSDLPPGENN